MLFHSVKSADTTMMKSLICASHAKLIQDHVVAGIRNLRRMRTCSNKRMSLIFLLREKEVYIKVFLSVILRCTLSSQTCEKSFPLQNRCGNWTV